MRQLIDQMSFVPLTATWELTLRCNLRRGHCGSSAGGDRMRPVRMAEDIVPVSDFKAQAAEWLKRLAENGQPLDVRQNGKAAGVLISPAEFDRLTERARFVAAVCAGFADEQAGRVVGHEAVVAEMKRRAHSRRPAR